MKKKCIIVIALAAAAVLGLLVWLVLPPREPVYQGKTLTQWAVDMNDEDLFFREAVRSVGTNAIPVLLRLLRVHDPPLKVRLLSLAGKQPWFKFQHTDPHRLNYAGLIGFFVLTNRAAPAVPELIRIYQQHISPVSQGYVANILAVMGPDARMAIPMLLPDTSSTNTIVRQGAFYVLANIHENPDTLVPIFVRGLSDPSTVVQYHSARGLGNFGPAAQAGVPALIDQIRKRGIGMLIGLGSEDPALDALKKIDPAAVEKLKAELANGWPGN